MSLWPRFKAWLFPYECGWYAPDDALDGEWVYYGPAEDGSTVRALHPAVAPGEAVCPSGSINSIAHDFWVACDVRCPDCKAQR